MVGKVRYYMIEVLHLFPKLNSSLIGVLEGLSTTQWNCSTLCKKYTVKDIAAHLLDTALLKISAGRDGYLKTATDINVYGNLLDFFDGLNADWVKAYKRISPQVLTCQIACAQDEYYKYLLTLDLSAPAMFPVSWAGGKQSMQWFDIAREYTRRWHHQQQIRQAVGAVTILQREFYYPFLDICMQVLPFHYNSEASFAGALVKVNVVGDSGGSWSIVKRNHGWEFTDQVSEAEAQVYIDQNIAWMLFSKGIDIFEAEQYWQVTGNYDLGAHALKMNGFIL